MDWGELQAALDEERWIEALERSLEAWRKTRHPRLAALVREVSRRATRRFHPPRARTSDEFEIRWLEVATEDASSLATGWLAETFGQKVPPVHRPFRERLPALHRRPADPRVASALVGVLRRGKFGGGTRREAARVYGPLVELIRAIGDATVAPELAAIGAEPRASRASVRHVLAELLPPVAEELGALQPLVDLDEAHLSQVVDGVLSRSTSNPHGDSASLLDHVLANPADESARVVLGDAWLAEGSERGKLVALERDGARPDDKPFKRLVRKNLAHWIGEDIASVIVNPVFRNGLLHEASLRPTSAASATTWQRVTKDVRLASVRRFWIRRGSHTWYPKLVTSEVMRDLRRIEVRTEDFLDALLRGPAHPYEGLHFRYPPRAARLRELAGAFPTLRALAVPHPMTPEAAFDVIEQGGWPERLTELSFEDIPEYEGVQLEEWMRRAERPPVLSAWSWLLERLPALERLEVSCDDYHYEIAFAFVRTAEGWTAELRCDPWANGGPQVLRDGQTRFVFDRSPTNGELLTLPPEITEVRVERPPSPQWMAMMQEIWGIPVTAR